MAGWTTPLWRCSSRSSPLARGKAGVGQVQPLDQDADEGAVDVAAAGDGRLLEVGDADAHDVRVLRGGDGGAALAALEREVGHLAEALARAEHGQQLAVLGDPRLAFDQEAEEVARL